MIFMFCPRGIDKRCSFGDSLCTSEIHMSQQNELRKDMRLLDMAAAPGGKTTVAWIKHTDAWVGASGVVSMGMKQRFNHHCHPFQTFIASTFA